MGNTLDKREATEPQRGEGQKQAREKPERGEHKVKEQSRT